MLVVVGCIVESTRRGTASYLRDDPGLAAVGVPQTLHRSKPYPGRLRSTARRIRRLHEALFVTWRRDQLISPAQSDGDRQLAAVKATTRPRRRSQGAPRSPVVFSLRQLSQHLSTSPRPRILGDQTQPAARVPGNPKLNAPGRSWSPAWGRRRRLDSGAGWTEVEGFQVVKNPRRQSPTIPYSELALAASSFTVPESASRQVRTSASLACPYPATVSLSTLFTSNISNTISSILSLLTVNNQCVCWRPSFISSGGHREYRPLSSHRADVDIRLAFRAGADNWNTRQVPGPPGYC